jgi:hypothetical protein
MTTTSTATGPSIDLLLEINAAFNSRDVDRILSFFAEDATFLMARGPEPCGRRVHGKAAIGKVLADRFKVISGMRWDHIDHFVTANRWVAKKSAKVKSLADLKGKTIVSTAGTTNIKQITEINAQQNLGMNIISANGHPEAFQMVETGRAVAFVMDVILLAGLAAQSRNPKAYEISAKGLSDEPYGIMLRKDDPAFKKVVDAAMVKTYKSGAINAIYQKWFQKPVPPKGVNLNLPMSAAFKKVVAKPTDSGDPKDYE